MTWLIWAGFALQAIGTAVAGFALWEDWYDHAHGRPLLPAIPRFIAWIRRKLGLRPPHQEVHAGFASGTATLSGSAEGYAAPALDAPLEEQVQWLRKHMTYIDERLSKQRQEIAAVGHESKARDADLAAKVDTVDRELRTTLDDFATGRVRMELGGLALVLVGSAISTAASLA